MTAGGSFYIIPTALMLIATVLSLAYSLRFISNVFFGQPKTEAKTVDVPKFMKVGMIILAVLTVIIGIYPTFFLNLIGTVHFI
jgi:formate hydrogenlyase subunit 3/multisubunit Na+/H+ antiporter MnhD subunit